MNSNNVLDVVNQEVSILPQTDLTKELVLQAIERIKKQTLNILLVGATGVGKSSTINAVFNADVAKVGYSPEPETNSTQTYTLGNLILWDTPGLGDSPENDSINAVQIANALKARDSQGNLLIDLVLVIVDGSSRDLKTTYEVIEQIIAPYIGEQNRILVAINQCDLALKGRDWSDETGPGSRLTAFLEEKVISIQQRLIASTGIHTQPVYYSALYRYNISKLVVTLIQKMPESKRFLIADTLNKNPSVWQKNDDIANYNAVIQEEVRGSLTKAVEGAAKGAVAGATVGNLVPVIGPVVGAAVGAVLGFLGGLMD